MKLVKINDDLTIDADKLIAISTERNFGRVYTRIYLEGDKDFLVQSDEFEIRKIIEKEVEKC